MLMDSAEKKYINLGTVERIPHIQLFEMVSVVIAEDNLEYINMNSKKVNPKDTIYTRYGKRLFDIVLSSIALLLTLPINLILAICTYFDVGMPIIFKQRRTGKDGRIFNLLPPSLRVTKFGKFVRKTSLDELLNFWCIFKGDMSIIGPRPLPIEYENFYSERHKARNKVRPGLECPIMKPLENGATWLDRFEQEIFYVENVSFILDIKMAFAIIKIALDNKSRNTRGSATGGSFMGYRKDGTCINSKTVEIEYFNEAIRRMGYSE